MSDVDVLRQPPGSRSGWPGSEPSSRRPLPFDLMLLAVGGIMQWLAMIAILVAQNAQGNVQDEQVEHLHQLGVTTHKLVVENTELTEAIHDHLIGNKATAT